MNWGAGFGGMGQGFGGPGGRGELTALSIKRKL